MKRLLIVLLFAFPAWAGPNTVHVRIGLFTNTADPQVNTFCASNLSCTVSGAWTLTGQNTVSAFNFNNWLWVDNVKFTTPEGAIATCPASPRGCDVWHSPFTSTSAGFTLGAEPPVSTFGQTFRLLSGGQVTLNGKINLLGSGRLNGENNLSSTFTAGGSFPSTTPMIEMGDNIGTVDATVDTIRLNCQSVTGCIGVRARGINDNSFIRRMAIQNYLTNCFTIDGSTVITGNFLVEGNFCAAATGAADAMSFNNVNGGGAVLFNRNSTVSNSGAAITGAGLKLFGNASGSTTVSIAHHTEKHTDGTNVCGNNTFVSLGEDVGNSTTNGIHICSTFVGSVFAAGIHNNGGAGGFPVILNDLSSTNESSANPPAPNGAIPFYSFTGTTSSNFSEALQDINGFHFNTKVSIGTSIFTPVAQLHLKANSALVNPLEIDDLEASGKNVVFGPGTKVVGRVSIVDASDASTELFDCNLLSTGGCNIRQGGLAVAGGITPEAAGVGDLGSTALPHGNLWLGTAATNNFKFQPAAAAGARIITITDPVSPTTVGLPLTIANSTATMAAGSVAAATCATAVTVAATGVATTDSIVWAYATAPTLTTDALLHISPYVTAGNVNFTRCNPTAGAIVGTAIVINWRVIR